MNVSKELVRGSLVPIVLKLLDERPMYGYEIVKLVNARTNGVLEWKEGTLYPTLHKLEADGLLKGEWRDAPSISGEESARQRKYYLITRSGRAELKERTGEWAAFSNAVGLLLNHP